MRWIVGYSQTLRSGERSYPGVLSNRADPDITFGDLVELMYVRGFRKAGVSLGQIRDVAHRYRDQWAVEYPFATKRFATDGRSLLIQSGDTWSHALTGQQSAFFEELGKQLVHIGDLAAEWRPLGAARHVVLTPRRAFGKPIEDQSGTHTFILAQALGAGDSAQEIARWYECSEQGVLDAVDFERVFSATKRGGDISLR
jgi:uncharacterized protein (DUF433 family)